MTKLATFTDAKGPRVGAVLPDGAHARPLGRRRRAARWPAGPRTCWR